MATLSRFVVKDCNLHKYGAVYRGPSSLISSRTLQAAHLDVRAGVSLPENGKGLSIQSKPRSHALNEKYVQGLDQLRSGLLQQQKTLIQSSQPFSQLQLQQQLLFQAQQNLSSQSANDFESRKMRMLLNNQIMGLGKDGQLNSVGDVVPRVGSPKQFGSPVLSHGDTGMPVKLHQQQMHQNNQQFAQNPLSSQQSQNSNPQLQQQDKTAPKNQGGRKRKQPGSSSGPANSTGTASTTGPSPSSPSTHTPRDAISMPNLPQNSGSSKSFLMFGSDGSGSLTSTPNQLIDDNVESFSSHDDPEPRDRMGWSGAISKGITFMEVQLFPASTSKVESCHFSADGKLLAAGGHDKKAALWCTESLALKSTLEEHSQWITDVRFSSSMSRLATSSADGTVRVWDASPRKSSIGVGSINRQAHGSLS